MNTILPVPSLLIEEQVKATLLEDFGRRGDITSNAVIPAGTQTSASMVARQDAVIAGMEAALVAFFLTDPSLNIEIAVQDGQIVEAGTTLCTIQGEARSILAAERTALNFLSHLSGIATATKMLVDLTQGTKAQICCTRKTTPGFRALEKYAVQCGGGSNHRYGLDDAILIKDNHIAVAGSIENAVTQAKQAIGHMTKIEVEVDTLEQLETLLTLPVDAVLLDNMDGETLAQAVAMIAGKITAEASGGINPETVRAIAESGVDLISSGWITHSAPIIDIGLDIS